VAASNEWDGLRQNEKEGNESENRGFNRKTLELTTTLDA